jgi:serine protease Do
MPELNNESNNELKVKANSSKLILGIAAATTIGTVAILGTIGGLEANSTLPTKSMSGVQSISEPNLPVNIANIVERGWLGVRIQSVTKDLANSVGLDDAGGALVSRVMPNSPAQKAGLKRGDVILGVNSENVKKLRDLPRLVAALKVDKKARFKVWREGKKISLNVKIGKMQGAQKLAHLDQTTKPNKNNAIPSSVSGMKLAALDDRIRQSLGEETQDGGVVITDVLPNSAAAETGLHQGDIILSVGNKTVSKPADVMRTIDEAKKNDRRAVLLLVKRRGIERFVALLLKKA